MLPYTICFIKRKNQILLLNREKKPNMGMWNGVGGKIEAGETPYQSVLREIYEETSIRLTDVTYSGKVVWQSTYGCSGMYVFMADLPEEYIFSTPLKVDEGILDWKEIGWIFDQNNTGVVGNLQLFLPKMLAGEHELEHTFIYENGVMLDYKTSPNKIEQH